MATIALTENMGLLSKAPTKPDFVSGSAEKLAFSVAFSRSASLFRSRSDTLGLSDTQQHTILARRDLTETVGLTNVAGFVLVANRGIVENVGLVAFGAFDRLVSISISISQSLGLLDSLGGLQAIRNRSLSENLALLNAFGATIVSQRGITDSLGLKEKLPVRDNYKTGNAERLAGQDQLGGVSRWVFRTSTDSLALSDLATKSIHARRSTTDQFGMADSYTRSSTANRPVVVQLGLSDSATRSVNVFRIVTEQLASTEELIKSVEYARAITQNMRLGDQFSTRLVVAIRGPVCWSAVSVFEAGMRAGTIACDC